MSNSNCKPLSIGDRMRAFLDEPKENDSEILARIERKIDALTKALIQPQSSIILVGDDIARIAAELKRKGGAA